MNPKLGSLTPGSRINPAADSVSAPPFPQPKKPTSNRRQFLRHCSTLATGAVLLAPRLRARTEPDLGAVQESFPRTDAHVHFAADTPEALQLLGALNLKLLNICVGRTPRGTIRAEYYRDLAAQHPRHFAWCTSIDAPDFTDPAAYAEKTIRQLDEDFAQGALACKVWKNIGLEIKHPSGRYLMVDDPILAPVFSHLEKAGKPLLMHIAEPQAAWLPLEEGGIYNEYYKKNPQYHFYGRKDIPSHAALIAARDRVVERHPRLTVVGAHLGSLEYDVDELARRFDRYPNFFVDTSGLARARSLARQDAAKGRAFFFKYSDRLMFGTDQVVHVRLSALPAAQQEAALQNRKENVLMAENFYRVNGRVDLKAQEAQGLGLPPEVLAKLFCGNARRTYPGL
jgi:predicted TIM-barrel fold metal-dependent hydrolase